MNSKKKTRTRAEQQKIAEANANYKNSQANVLGLRAGVAMAQARVSEARVEALNKRTELEAAVTARKNAKAMLDSLRQ